MMSGPRVVRLSLDGVVPEDTRLLLALGGGGKPCDVTDAVGDLAWACDLALAGTALGHDYDPDHRERARAIGEALHRAGGRDAMAAVHDALLRLAGAER